jgi:hypothetical protein
MTATARTPVTNVDHPVGRAQDVAGIRTMVVSSLLEAVSDLPGQSNENSSLCDAGLSKPIVDEFRECGWMREKQHGRSDLCATRRWCCDK